jgi:hypothetical protein
MKYFFTKNSLQINDNCLLQVVQCVDLPIRFANLDIIAKRFNKNNQCLKNIAEIFVLAAIIISIEIDSKLQENYQSTHSNI